MIVDCIVSEIEGVKAAFLVQEDVGVQVRVVAMVRQGLREGRTSMKVLLSGGRTEQVCKFYLYVIWGPIFAPYYLKLVEWTFGVLKAPGLFAFLATY